MSIRLPLSDERTSITSPTWPSRIARMSSISGPGQKLPRASTVRVIVGILSVSVMTGSMPFSERSGAPDPGSDEQRSGALGHQADDRGRADGLGHAVDHVLGLEPEHVHGHLAGDELDAHE